MQSIVRRSRILLVCGLLVFSIICLISCGNDAKPTADGETYQVVDSEDKQEDSEPTNKEEIEQAPDRVISFNELPPIDVSAYITLGPNVQVTWPSKLSGDYNSDGTVNGSDVFPLALNFNRE